MIGSLVSRPPAAPRRWLTPALGLVGVLAALAILRLPLPEAAALLGVTAVVLLVLADPLWGLGLALLFGPFGALENVVFGGSLLDSGQLLLLLTLAAWAAGNLARRRFFIPRLSLALPLALFLFVTSLTLLDADSLTLGFRELLKWVEMGLIIVLIANIAWERGDPRGLMRRLAAMLLLAGTVQALIGIWQFGLRGDGPEHFLVLGRFYRAYGTFEQPNPFGGYMNLTAMLALGLLWGLFVAWFLNRRAGRPALPGRFWLWLAFAAVAAGLCSVALVFSWSRGAWLGFLAGLATLVLFSVRRWMLGLGILLVSGGLFVGLLWAGLAAGFGPAQSVESRLLGFASDFTFGDVRGVDINDENYAVIERLAHWQAALGMAQDDLWTGVGFGGYEAAYGRYALINWPDALGHSHNYYLNLLAETGMPGLLAYLFFWASVLWLTYRAMRDLPWPERGLAVGLQAAWVALAVHHLVDKLYVNNIYIHLGAMLGLLQLLVGLAAVARRDSYPASPASGPEHEVSWQ